MSQLLSIHVEETVLKAGDSVSDCVDLKAQALALLHIEAKGFFGSVRFYAPDSTLVRGHDLSGDRKRPLAFVADAAGRYRIQISSAPGKPVGILTLTLDRVVSLHERLSLEHSTRLEGSRIRQLRSEPSGNIPGAVEAFWREIEKTGTPLCEPDPNDTHLTLCTFLWRGDENTHRVCVDLGFDTAIPNDYSLTQIEGTNVWFTTIRIRSMGRFKYQLAVNAADRPKQVDTAADWDLWEMHRASAQSDPLNPDCAFDEDTSSKYEVSSLITLPDAPPQPWLEQRPNIARGSVVQHLFTSKRLNDERTISVYLPPGYTTTAKPYGRLLIFDEQWYLSLIPTPTILDNLLAGSQVPPLVAIIIGNGPGDARGRQLSCNPALGEFLVNELLPWTHDRYNVTSDPSHTVVAGASLGGLAATYVALRHPEVFGNVLSQSGSYWWIPSNGPDQPDNMSHYKESNYMAELFTSSPRLPIRFYINPGSEERDLTGNGADILVTSRTLKNVLLAKGYEIGYSEFVGGHDFLSWRGTLADGLIFLAGPWLDSAQ